MESYGDLRKINFDFPVLKIPPMNPPIPPQLTPTDKYESRHPMSAHLHTYRFLFCGHLISDLPTHTSKINNLRSRLNSKEMLQNFLYLYKKKKQVIFFVFHFEQLSFSPYECPGLCRHIPGHLLGKK